MTSDLLDDLYFCRDVVSAHLGPREVPLLLVAVTASLPAVLAASSSRQENVEAALRQLHHPSVGPVLGELVYAILNQDGWH